VKQVTTSNWNKGILLFYVEDAILFFYLPYHAYKCSHLFRLSNLLPLTLKEKKENRYFGAIYKAVALSRNRGDVGFI